MLAEHVFRLAGEFSEEFMNMLGVLSLYSFLAGPVLGPSARDGAPLEYVIDGPAILGGEEVLQGLLDLH